ncbi:MAG: PHP domain-containing protein [Clostridia bacterium]|nr:PHP domain-containing protein [Clostridia bacterium]
MLCDLHNHTYFSYDGMESPEKIVENAIANGVGVVGICDHQFTDGFDFNAYVSKMRAVRDSYNNRCSVKTGLEIGTRPKPDDFLAKSASKLLDYCLFESLDSEKGMDLYEFLEWRRLFSCPVGLAHTDIFALSERYGVDMLKIMREHELFWEINTSGNYTYYYDFLTNRTKQRAVKESGITLSVGSDTHQLYNFSLAKLTSANQLCAELGNPMLFGKEW